MVARLAAGIQVRVFQGYGFDAWTGPERAKTDLCRKRVVQDNNRLQSHNGRGIAVTWVFASVLVLIFCSKQQVCQPVKKCFWLGQGCSCVEVCRH